MMRAANFWHPSGVQGPRGMRTGGIGWVQPQPPATLLHPSGVDGAVGGHIARIKFVKFGRDGVYIQTRRNGGAWGFVTIDTETPYLDNTPLLVANTPETREYA